MLRRALISLALIFAVLFFFVLPFYANALQYTDGQPPERTQTLLGLAAWAQSNRWAFVAGVGVLALYLLVTSFGWLFQQVKNR